MTKRNRNIVVKSQFNINGSRGRDVGKFIAEYVSRDSATGQATSYIPDPNKVPVQGDGVAFTLDSTGISRDETLRLASKVQDFHRQGDRAIQQLVISFDHDYLIDQGIIPSDILIKKKGDYDGQYDDTRLRHAVIQGIQSLIDNENYRDGRMVAAIQHDTLHLHVHAVVYENHPKLARMRGKEEKGVVKDSSFQELTSNIDRVLKLSRLNCIPTQKTLTIKTEFEKPNDMVVVDEPNMDYLLVYMQLAQNKANELEAREKQEKLEVEKAAEELEKHNQMMREYLEGLDLSALGLSHSDG